MVAVSNVDERSRSRTPVKHDSGESNDVSKLRDQSGQPEDMQTKSFSDDISSNVSNANEGSTEAILSGKVDESGRIVDSSGNAIGKVIHGDISELVGMNVDQEGDILDPEGNVIGRAEPLEKLDKAEDIPDRTSERAEDSKNEAGDNVEDATPQTEAPADQPADQSQSTTEKLQGGIAKAGNMFPKLQVPSKESDAADQAPAASAPEESAGDLSALKGLKPNKAGNIVDGKGKIVARVVDGDPKKLAGRPVDESGNIWNDTGKIVGRAELVPEDTETPPKAPFADFLDSKIEKNGTLTKDGQVIGKIVEGDPKELAGKSVDEDGDISDAVGNVIGKAERYDEPEPEAQEVDFSILSGKKVNKGGRLVDENGKVFGKVADGDLKQLVGKHCDKNGNILDNSGNPIGRAEVVPESDQSDAPFADFPNATVNSDGSIVFEGKTIGKIVEGDAKKLAGKKVDEDGEILDGSGNVVGKAERWEEEEPSRSDQSALAGKKVNKLGNIVDEHGSLFGRVIEGDAKKLVGRTCDREGNIWGSAGEIVGKAELLPESEREAQREGPFTQFPNNTINKDGKVVNDKGEVIGRLIQGDAKQLSGKSVDEDGEVLDKNGNSIGKAERFEEEEKPKKANPYDGRKVNKDGNVFDESGNLLAKLTEGDAARCSGHDIDEDGDVLDSKNKVIGHVTPIADIKDETSSEDAKKEQEQEADRKLAEQMANCISVSIDKIKPILKMIDNAISQAENTPKDELDEQKLVEQVKPLIEQGSEILQEANGVIRGLDPDGRIQNKAKHNTSGRDASPEEYRLAELLKELTGSVTETIENAKKKISGMPHAKKELNPLWGLLAEPLGQILAAVGLLLSGVLGLVGRLLSGLGLGGLLDGLLGGLGLDKVLEGLGLGVVTKSLGIGKNRK